TIPGMTPLSFLDRLRVVAPAAVVAAAAGAVGFVMGPAGAAELRTITVTNDLVLETNAALQARLVVAVSHITIEGSGATLQGPGPIGDPKSLERAGRGIELQGCVDVTVRHLSAHGFATGLAARDGQGLVIEDCDFSDNYDNPKHGWGELPSRGGVLLQRV